MTRHTTNLNTKICAKACAELEQNWKAASTGLKLREHQASQLPILTDYWSCIQHAGEVTVSYRRCNPERRAFASANNQSAWSAAFICAVFRKAGVTLDHGFEFSRRHITYITKAIMNRASFTTHGLKNGLFLFYDATEFGPNTADALFDSIQLSDLICLNRRRKNRTDRSGKIIKGRFTRHTLKSLSRITDLRKIRDVSHCDIVVKKFHKHGKNYITTIGGNVRHSVSRKTFEVHNEKIFLIKNGERRTSHYFGFVRFTP